MSAHKGPKVGQGYTRSIANSKPYLSSGKVLVHCTHGADRTGAILGAWLWSMRATVKTLPGGGSASSREDLWKYADDFGNWTGKICSDAAADNQGYAWYLDGFYPFASWCKQGSRAKTCRSCICKGYGKLPGLDGSGGSAAPPPPPDKCAAYPGSTYYSATSTSIAGCYSGPDLTGFYPWHGPGT